MRKIDADAFREELIRDRNNDVNMYHSHIDKEIRDEKYDFAIEELDSQPTVDEWIPCDERLPELDDEGNSEFVQVTIHTPTSSITNRFVTEAWYSEKENNWYPRGKGLCIGRVIAWKPLSEPYDK